MGSLRSSKLNRMSKKTKLSVKETSHERYERGKGNSSTLILIVEYSIRNLIERLAEL